MARFTHSIIVPNQAIAADGAVNYDLPVGPLSALLIHLSPLNNTATIANYRQWAGLMSALDTIRITYRGASVIDLSGPDLAAWIMLCSMLDIMQSNNDEVDNDRRSLVIPIPFGRRVYDPAECFPQVKRGELIMTCTWDIADTGFDGLRISVEAIELPEAQPDRFQRVTTIARTFAVTGDNDVDLPLGNIIRQILCFGTTGFAGAAPAPTLGALALLINNVQSYFTSSDFEVSKAVSPLLGRRMSAWADHYHAVNAAGAGQEDTQQAQYDVNPGENYTVLPLDVMFDDSYSLNTKGLTRVHLRVTAETADAARFIITERVLANDFIRPPLGG